MASHAWTSNLGSLASERPRKNTEADLARGRVRRRLEAHTSDRVREDDPLVKTRSWAILEGENGCVGMIDAPDPDTALDEWALLHRDGDDAGLTVTTVEDAL